MTSNNCIIQLFNSKRRSNSLSLIPDSEPNHLRFEEVLKKSGFVVDTIPAHGWPWNPAAQMHSAYLGLDPIRAIRVLLTRRKAAIVCAHLESGLLVLLFRRLLRFHPPVIIWEVPWSPGWTYRKIVSNLAIPRADCCVVFSSNQIKAIHDLYGRSVRTALIPFCIDTEFYRPLSKSPGAEPYIFSCGIDPGRDFDILIQMAAQSSLHVKIKVGSGSSIPNNLPANVEIIREHLSYINLRTMYANASIIVVTTKDTPNACGVTTLMEGMSMGKPVIVSDNPALRDYLPPPAAGITIPIGDLKSLKAAVVDLLENPSKAEIMGRNARDFALSRFDPRLHFQKFADLIKHIRLQTSQTSAHWHNAGKPLW